MMLPLPLMVQVFGVTNAGPYRTIAAIVCVLYIAALILHE